MSISLDSFSDIKSLFSSCKDKFSGFLSIAAFLFRPYLRMKYEPKSTTSVEDALQKFFVLLSTWVCIAIIYIVFVYLCFYTDANGNSGKIADFINKPIRQLVDDLIRFTSASPLFNITFFVVLYFAITNYAEKTYLSGKYLHASLAGLIKVIKIGKFDRSSKFREQDESQVFIARANMLAAVQDSTKELVSIVTTSGWDFFGDGPALGG